ncbi:MAG: hypothetical protein QOJ56_5671 [Mycobacterium sp.]|nr:hypothetical protein [Mycobacterium sp.]MDT5357139.1 hypothetical protein [Mycobacterium sp.]
MVAEIESAAGGVVSREPEAQAVADFLTSACHGPSALIIAGEAGIGKTTAWLAAVLSVRAAAAESVLAYAALADLLAGVEPAALSNVPLPQRLAIDRILLRAGVGGPQVDQHAVAAGFLSILEGLGERSPVLVAIDDLQWLDPSSAQVLAFVVRRLNGPVGVLGTARDDADSVTSWLHLPTPDAIGRITLRPLSIGAVNALISGRLGRAFPRPTTRRIHEVSGETRSMPSSWRGGSTTVRRPRTSCCRGLWPSWCERGSAVSPTMFKRRCWPWPAWPTPQCRWCQR